jgi:hypothetical protein
VSCPSVAQDCTKLRIYKKNSPIARAEHREINC